MARTKRQSGAGREPKGDVGRATRSRPPQPHQHVNFPAGDFETVDPVWLLKAGALTLLAAALLAYASVCVYISVGAWNILLRPSPTVAQAPGEPYTAVRFDAAETGTPRLSGWWIPASVNEAGAITLLYLHGGDGSLGTTVAELDQLHQAGINLFAFDYRGYGQSGGPHPTEQRMLEDSSAALTYLVNTRHLAPAAIVPYGTGLGAVMAAKLMKQHGELPAVAIANPWPNAAELVLGDPRYRLLPIGLLLTDRFDLEEPLNSIAQPRLLISGGPGAAESRHDLSSVKADTDSATTRLTAYFGTIADPKMIILLTSAHAQADAPANVASRSGQDTTRLDAAVAGFLEQYLHTAKPSAPVDHTGTLAGGMPAQ